MADVIQVELVHGERGALHLDHRWHHYAPRELHGEVTGKVGRLKGGRHEDDFHVGRIGAKEFAYNQQAKVRVFIPFMDLKTNGRGGGRQM